MKKLLFLFLCIGLISNIQIACAEEDINQEQPLEETVAQNEKTISEEVTEANTDENVSEKTEDSNTEHDNNVTAADISSLPVPQTEYEEVKELTIEKVSLPDCEDKKLIETTESYIKEFFDKVPNEGTIYRRRRYFILKNLDKFKEENIANYKTAETSPVSDIIADIKVNKGIAEENMRLCKNQSKDQYAGKVYILIYPDENEIKVRVINLVVKQTIGIETTFVYKK